MIAKDGQHQHQNRKRPMMKNGDAIASPTITMEPILSNGYYLFDRNRESLMKYPQQSHLLMTSSIYYGNNQSNNNINGIQNSDDDLDDGTILYSPTRINNNQTLSSPSQQQQLTLMKQQYFKTIGYQQNKNNNNYRSRKYNYNGSTQNNKTAIITESNNDYEEDFDFDIANAIFSLISLTSYLVSLGASFALAYFLYHHENDQTLLATVTVAAILLPSIIVNVLSLKW